MRIATPQHDDTTLVQNLRQQLEEAEQTIASSVAKEMEQAQGIANLQEALASKDDELAHTHEEEVVELKQQLAMEKERARNSWRVNCEHLAERDSIITAHEEEIAALKRQLSDLQAQDATHGEDTSRLSARPSSMEPARHADTAGSPHGGTPGRDPPRTVPDSDPTRSEMDPPATLLLRDPITTPSSKPGGDSSSTSPPIADAPPTDPPDGRRCQGRAPPIEFFTGEDPSILLDDWLPCLERAATWNEWTVDDKLMQLPGYLKGRALQEWRLLPRSEQQSYPVAVEALRARLDPGSKTVAAQEFRHSLQRSGKTRLHSAP